MNFLRQSTASQVRILGPFVDDTDGKTAATALTINASDIKLMANGGSSANKNSGGGTHRINGHYSVTFNATDTATVGELAVSVVVAGALPVWTKFFVLEEAVFDALFAASSVGPLTTLGATAPANWLNAAAIAAAALNGKGDWATAGAAMALTTGERSTLAAAIEAAMINEGDATALLQAIADKIADANIDFGDLTAAGIASAVWGNTTRTLTANPGLDATGVRTALGLATANLDTKIAEILSAFDEIECEGGGGGITSEQIAAWAAAVVAEFSASSLMLSELGRFISASEINIRQGDDYLATKGTAYEKSILLAGYDFTAAGLTVRFGAGTTPGTPLITGTASLHNKAVGSVTLRLEFTRDQTKTIAQGTYNWDVEVVDVDGKVTTIDGGILNLQASWTTLA